MDSLDVLVNAKKTGLLKFATMVEYEISKLLCEQGEHPEAILQRRYNYLQSLREKNSRAYWGLFSIRPAENNNLIAFLDTIHKITRKKWLKDNCCYVFEQKGESLDTQGEGMHAHILFVLHGVLHGKKQKSRKQCLDEVIDTMERSSIKIESQGVDLRTGSKEDLGQVYNYLVGDKADAKKHAAQEIDKVWREANEMQDLYGNSKWEDDLISDSYASESH